MSKALNIARMSSTTTGSGDTIDLTGTVTGFKSLSASGAVDTDQLVLCIEEGDNREVGLYTYNAAGPTLTRLTVYDSTNSDSAITLAGSAQIFSSATAEFYVGKFAKFFSAAEFIPRLTNGPSRGLTETATNDAMLDTLDFDQTTQEGATLFYKPPKSWDLSTITFIAYWTADAGTAAQTFELELDAVAISNDDVLDVAWGTAVGVSDALIATGDLHISSESSAVTAGGTPQAGDSLLIRVKRDVANDDLAADARLLGVEIFFTTNVPNDA